jgi:hypothetical protein
LDFAVPTGDPGSFGFNADVAYGRDGVAVYTTLDYPF